MSKKNINEQIVEAIKNEKLGDIKNLLKEGANPNHQFKIGDKEYTLLHMAVFYEDIPFVKLLVENGADINKLSYVNGKKNKLGNLTPIQYTVLNGTQEPDNFKVLKYLLSKEANIYIRNSTGNHTRDLSKFREKKDKNKKYLKTIDDFIKGKNKLKEKLQEAGYDPGPKDGIMGPATRTAISEFQKSRAWIADGYPHPEVLEAFSISAEK